MISTRQIRVSSKATRLWDMTVNAASFIAGLVVGVFIGLWDAIVGIFEGIASIFEFIGTLAQKIWNGEFTTYISELWEKIKNFFNKIPDVLDKAFTDFGNMSAWDQGKSIDRIIGMIFFDVIITILTVGALTAIKWAGRFTEGMVEILDKLKLTEKSVWVKTTEELPKPTALEEKKVVQELEDAGKLEKKEPANDRDISVENKKEKTTHEKDKATEKEKTKNTLASEITPETEKHIFEGEINSQGKATGVHHIDAINNGTARIVEGSVIEGPNGLYKARVEVKNGTGDWILKSATSSFFPDAWSKQKVLEEISNAFNNKSFISGNTWEGMSRGGIKIRMYLNQEGKIISAFPIF